MNKAESASARPSRRARGRPARLSAQAILDTTIQLLDEVPAEDLSLHQLAKALGVTPMSLYTYFPSRDALLDAAAEQLFSRFEWPEQEGAWRDQLVGWMRALARHFERYPAAWKVVRWGQHVSPAWIRVFAPAVSIIYRQGLRGEALARTTAWFIEVTVGFITATSSSREAPSTEPVFDEMDIPAPDAAAIKEFWIHAVALDPDAKLEAGFQHIADSVEACIRQYLPSRKPARKTR